MIITPSEDPSVFRAMIWAGYNTLEMEDMDYSEDGVALGANVLTQNLEVGVPGTGDLSQMAKGTYNPKGEYKANSMAGKVTNTDLNLQLEGFTKRKSAITPKKGVGGFHRRRWLYRRRWRGLHIQRERHGWPRAVDSNL